MIAFGFWNRICKMTVKGKRGCSGAIYEVVMQTLTRRRQFCKLLSIYACLTNNCHHLVSAVQLVKVVWVKAHLMGQRAPPPTLFYWRLLPAKR